MVKCYNFSISCLLLVIFCVCVCVCVCEMIVILVTVKWYLLGVLIFISIVANDTEYLLRLLYIFFRELSIQIPCLFLIGLSFLVLLALYRSRYKSLIRYIICKTFLLWVIFSLSEQCLLEQEVCNSDDFQFTCFLLLLLLVFLVPHLILSDPN